MFILSALLIAQVAYAQNKQSQWPDRPIRMIVPFSAGGPIDIVARRVGQKLSDALKTPVVIDYKAGANGLIGADYVAKAAPDGYTMLIMTGSFSANAALYKKLPFDPIKDFAPISQVYRTYGMVLVVNNDLPVNSLKDLIAYGNANPGKLSYGSGGYGNASHLVGELLNVQTGLSILHVPYKGLGPAFNEVVARQVDMTYISTATAANGIKENIVKGIAISGTARSPAIPNVPTFTEAGVKGVDQVFGWSGLFYPAGTPKLIVDKVQQALARVLSEPDMKKQFDDLGIMPVGSSSAEFSKFVTQDIELQAQLFKTANISQQ
ncbi:tripartite tricarboxylate transporter substrate binding protein [Polynucleobacter sp. UK-Mo-2m-Kol15]|uniref:Bug family tripartite tricarboxylate transporter substrate binding protein n=1 Tax=Polynucleobacter sp. UK-Mo-2m-Kol15 TaxID=2576916 RepID=UPI001C0B0811|nr:tripartite tricarboxylate transporter substrate binding protein [Polynucleobacter sp. UK-Mo-2m-Kol15]